MAKKDEMLAHKERNGAERNIFVRSVSIVAVHPELAPLVTQGSAAGDSDATKAQGRVNNSPR